MVQEVDGETFEGVSVRHRPPHSILELLVTAGSPRAALQLVRRQGGGQDVGQVVIPHCGQAKVLEGDTEIYYNTDTEIYYNTDTEIYYNTDTEICYNTDTEIYYNTDTEIYYNTDTER